MLEMKNVSFAYGAENVLEKINFKLESGDFWAVIGPNGGGKTTFVKLLLGLLKPNKGEISYTSNIQPCHIGNVPQMTYHNIQFPICVRDTIALGLLQPRIFGFNPKKSQDSIFQAMELLEITHLAKKPLYALSGGERQKVLIARAIVNNPQILILDEPTANIDSKAQKSIYELLKKLNRTMSIVVVSHDLSLTLGYAKKVLYVNKNAVIHEIPDFKLDVSGHICEVDLLTHFAMQPNNSSFEREHSVLSDKSRITSAEAAALTPSKLLASASQNHDLLKKPAAASPCTASLVFSSQSLECQDSNDMESQANSSNSKIVSEKCGLQGKSQGSLLNANDRRDFSQLPYLSPQAELPTYGVVLMQNSGLSNALSPLTSLNYTFKIPILGFVSLRGERDSSGKNTDEPQHGLLGVITDTLLGTCEMKYAFLDSNMDRAKMQVQEALEWLEKGESFFFIVRDKTFSKIALSNAGNSSLSQSLNECGNSARSFASSKLPSPRFAQHSNLSQDTRIADSKSLESQTNPKINTTTLETKDSSNTESKPDSKPTQPANTMPTRLEALEVLHTLAKDSKALLLATTGKCGRELYEIEDSPNQLYMVGSMGCVSSLSLGIALKTRQKVIAIDGDSALLMRLGALSTNAYYTRDRDNFCHILLDNESHDSTGGQFNLSPFVDFSSIAKSCGYVNVCIAESLEEFELHIKAFLTYGNSSLGSHLQNTRIADSNIAKSQADSATLKVAKHDFATIQINGGDSQSEMPTLKALSGWGIFKGEQVARPRADKQFKPLPLKEKNKKSKNQNISNKDTSPTAQYDKVIESKTNPSNLDSKKGAWFIYLKIQKGSKENLGRPKITPQEVAQRLSEYMRGCSDEF